MSFDSVDQFSFRPLEKSTLNILAPGTAKELASIVGALFEYSSKQGSNSMLTLGERVVRPLKKKKRNKGMRLQVRGSATAPCDNIMIDDAYLISTSFNFPTYRVF